MLVSPDPSRVRGLMDSPAFTQRILDRIVVCRGVMRHEDRSILVLQTQGLIITTLLERIVVIRIGIGQSLAARVQEAVSHNGTCCLTLRPWSVFVNHDPDRPALQMGIHLWWGAAWRFLPTTA